MNRLEKKCLIGTTLAHGLLGVVLMVGLAFKRSDVVVESVPGAVTMFPVTLIDGPSRGGNVNVASPPAQSKPMAQAVAQPPPPAPVAPPAPARVEEVEPPTPQPQTKVVESAPKPMRETPKQVENADFQETKPKKTAQKPPQKEYDFKPNSSTASKSKPSNSKQDFTFKEIRPANSGSKPAARTQSTASNSKPNTRLQELAQRLGSAGSSISQNIASGTTIEMPGAGGGGASAVNYAQFVKAIYDEAWRDPQDVSDESATVKTEIIIRRDGTIVSSKILNRSGVRGLDNSVQSAIDRVRSVRPFPEGATDAQRTFILKFNLKSKRSLG